MVLVGLAFVAFQSSVTVLQGTKRNLLSTRFPQPETNLRSTAGRDYGPTPQVFRADHRATVGKIGPLVPEVTKYTDKHTNTHSCMHVCIHAHMQSHENKHVYTSPFWSGVVPSVTGTAPQAKGILSESAQPTEQCACLVRPPRASAPSLVLDHRGGGRAFAPEQGAVLPSAQIQPKPRSLGGGAHRSSAGTFPCLDLRGSERRTLAG